MAKIKHMVVLMLENRSFDHMLGFLKSGTYPIDGLDGTETNPDSQGALVSVSNNARYVGDLKHDPSHDFISVNEQIFGNSQATGNGPFMQGFVKNYGAKTGNVGRSHNVMKCFRPGRLPALATLAQEYAICDRWFASVPGPTLPNRAFVYGATSQGRVNMSPQYFTLKTIFERLTEHGVSSKIYYTDWTFAQGVKHIAVDNPSKYFRFFDDFEDDCKNNKLPAYSFIEPRYYDKLSSGSTFLATDQHPDHNVFNGEKLIKAVYDAVTSNQQSWESTMLVITYDEHGGLYDHVRPPAAVNPDNTNSITPPFEFNRLGVRVPAVIISPFVPRGTIIHDVFDHTSIIATARKLFIQDFANSWLTERDRRANTFENCLTLANPRPGKVTIPQPSSPPLNLMADAFNGSDASIKAGPNSVPQTTANNPLSELQEIMVLQTFALESSLRPSQQTGRHISEIKTEQAAAEYIEEVQAKLKFGTAGRSVKARQAKVATKTYKAKQKGAAKKGSKR